MCNSLSARIVEITRIFNRTRGGNLSMANQPKKYKKFVATAATATLVASAIVPVAASAATPKFPDVGSDYADAVNAIADLGIVSGYTDGTFKPLNTVDRAGVVKFLGKFLVAQGAKLPTYEAATANGFPFSDLTASSDKELVQYASLVKAEGVFTGYTDGTLNPTQAMPRHQMASVLVKAIKVIYGIDLVAEAKAANFVSDITDIKGNVYEEAIAALDFAGLTVATQYDPSRTLNRGQFANFLSRSIDFVAEFEANKEPKVESVTAINAKQVEIKFNKAVKESDVIVTNNDVDYVNNTNIQLSSLDGANVTLGTGQALASLSEDGKTLTITTKAGEIFEGRYHVVVKDVTTSDFKDVAKVDTVVDLGEDTVAPSITTVTKSNAFVAKVNYSEPVVSGGNFTFKLADGTDVTSKVTVSQLASNGKSLTLTVNDSTLKGKTITATVLGIKDYANNVVKPNPTTFAFQVGQEDGVAPTISKVEVLSPTKVAVTFSEEVQNVVKEAVTIGGTPATAVEQDSEDAKVYYFTVADMLAGATSKLVDFKFTVDTTVSLVEHTLMDLSGEEMAKDFSQVLTVKKDTVAPKLVSSEVVTEGSNRYLVLKFDEVVTGVTTTGTPTAVKDYVTETGNLLLGTPSITSDNKGYKYDLTNIKFGPNNSETALVDGTKYTFNVVATDSYTNSSEGLKVEFTYSSSADSVKPEASFGTVTNSSIQLVFNKELDGKTATDVNNYTVEGVNVKSVVLGTYTGSTQTVTLNLDSNYLTGNRTVLATGVKSKSGVVMKNFTDVAYLIENIAPELTSAKITSTEKITLTFSEALDVSTVDDADFTIKIGDSELTATTDFTVAPDGNSVVVTLDTPLSDSQYNSTITVKVAKDAIEDLNENTTAEKTVTATK